MLLRQFQASLGHVRPYLKQTKQNEEQRNQRKEDHLLSGGSLVASRPAKPTPTLQKREKKYKKMKCP